MIENERTYLEYAEAYFGQRGRGGKGNFNSRGKGFTLVGRCNSKMVEKNFIPMLDRKTTIQNHSPKREIQLSNHSNIILNLLTNLIVKFVEDKIILPLIAGIGMIIHINSTIFLKLLLHSISTLQTMSHFMWIL